jgi:hypothetical protein
MHGRSRIDRVQKEPETTVAPVISLSPASDYFFQHSVYSTEAGRLPRPTQMAGVFPFAGRAHVPYPHRFGLSPADCHIGVSCATKR